MEIFCLMLQFFSHFYPNVLLILIATLTVPMLKIPNWEKHRDWYFQKTFTRSCIRSIIQTYIDKLIMNRMINDCMISCLYHHRKLNLNLKRIFFNIYNSFCSISFLMGLNILFWCVACLFKSSSFWKKSIVVNVKCKSNW